MNTGNNLFPTFIFFNDHNRLTLGFIIGRHGIKATMHNRSIKYNIYDIKYSNCITGNYFCSLVDKCNNKWTNKNGHPIKIIYFLNPV